MHFHRIRLKCGFTLGDIGSADGAFVRFTNSTPMHFKRPSRPVLLRSGGIPVYRSTPRPAQVIDCDKVLTTGPAFRGQTLHRAYLDLSPATTDIAKLRRRPRRIYLSPQEERLALRCLDFVGEEFLSGLYVRWKVRLPIKWWSHDRYRRSSITSAAASFVQLEAGAITHPRLEERSTCEERLESAI